MCGRYNDHLPKMIGWANVLKDWPKYQRSYNVAPSAKVAAFRAEAGELMRWGMVPSWAKEFDSKYATFNARIETVDEKPTFRSAWKKSQRCLIPMAGYFEWKGSKGDKQPFYINDRNAGVIVAAGLYETWGDEHLSCTMLTMPANDELANIHARMPVMLQPESASEWLLGNSTKNDLVALEAPNILYYPVSKAVGNTRNDSSELILPIDS